jgi:hypothetical protein
LLIDYAEHRRLARKFASALARVGFAWCYHQVRCYFVFAGAGFFEIVPRLV